MSRAAREPPKVRCAIYTRKSSEEGLDQAFNSLHAQREACEAYIRSQAGEGWSALSALYDDGGFSGGNVERPALRRLLADLSEGRIDVIVVYKIDRLTRSLMDFSRLVEQFDAASASFVSVTQAFNTTTSMGRLTLNVLLSFAQFEREVTGERIRDKIAASKAKGMWMGGTLPLGYDAPDNPATRSLRVNPVEARAVRQIFESYLQLGSVSRLETQLAAIGVRSKLQPSGRGGVVFSRGALLHLLKNRVYLGEILHKGVTRAVGHTAIVDPDLFQAVQDRIKAGARERRARPKRAAVAALTGLIFDGDGRPMSPTFSHGRGGRIYRYYVSAPLQVGATGASDDSLRRLPGPDTDTLILERMSRLAGRPVSPAAGGLKRVDVYADQAVLMLDLDALLGRRAKGVGRDDLQRRLEPGETWRETGSAALALVMPVRLKTRGGRSWLTRPSGQDAAAPGRMDRILVQGLAAAHALLAEHDARPIGPTEGLHQARAPVEMRQRKLAQLALLAPQIQAAIVEGRQPAGLKLEHLIRADLPLAWADQVAALGF